MTASSPVLKPLSKHRVSFYLETPISIFPRTLGQKKEKKTYFSHFCVDSKLVFLIYYLQSTTHLQFIPLKCFIIYNLHIYNLHIFNLHIYNLHIHNSRIYNLHIHNSRIYNLHIHIHLHVHLWLNLTYNSYLQFYINQDVCARIVFYKCI